MRVALVHDWLTGMRGGERVLEELVALYPDADIFTLLHVAGTVSPTIAARPIHTSFVQRLPAAATRYRHYLPLFPTAIELFDLRGYDLIISSSHCVAKGVRPAGTPHVCYCHTPMRYIWDQYDAYFGRGRASPWLRGAARIAAHQLRRWDVRTVGRVDRFIANSQHVAERIRRCYGRDAVVVHPPVNIERFRPAAKRGDHWICVGALVPYKRFDIAIAACTALEQRLIVIGDGPEYLSLRRSAGANVTFAGRLSDAEVSDLLGRAHGLIMPMVEDFGISAVEAQAAGTPVVAYAAGGALETVLPCDPVAGGQVTARGATGVFFHEQSTAALIDALRLRDRLEFDTAVLRANAERFTAAMFRARITAAVDALLAARRSDLVPAGS